MIVGTWVDISTLSLLLLAESSWLLKEEEQDGVPQTARMGAPKSHFGTSGTSPGTLHPSISSQFHCAPKRDRSVLIRPEKTFLDPQSPAGHRK